MKLVRHTVRVFLDYDNHSSLHNYLVATPWELCNRLWLIKPHENLYLTITQAIKNFEKCNNVGIAERQKVGKQERMIRSIKQFSMQNPADIFIHNSCIMKKM